MILTLSPTCIRVQWVEMARVMMVEAEWRMSGYAPSMEEYMPVAEPSFGLGTTVLTFLFFVGPELTEAAVRSSEYVELYHHMNVCGRLLNDLQSCERERAQGKTNSVLLLARRHGGSVEAAKEEARGIIAASRMKMLRMLVGRDAAGDVPWLVRREFWNICRVVHVVYMEVDGYASPKEMMRVANEVVSEPLRVPGTGKTTNSTRAPAESDKFGQQAFLS